MKQKIKKTQDIEKQLLQAISESKLSINGLARLSGVNQAMISRFINGQRSLTLPSAAKLAKVLGLEFHRVEDDDYVA
jgi:plasmid maintenance system antidote protein VapI